MVDIITGWQKEKAFCVRLGKGGVSRWVVVVEIKAWEKIWKWKLVNYVQRFPNIDLGGLRTVETLCRTNTDEVVTAFWSDQLCFEYVLLVMLDDYVIFALDIKFKIQKNIQLKISLPSI